MKTLKQILKTKRPDSVMVSTNPSFNQKSYWEKDIIEAVKEWLTQKRKVMTDKVESASTGVYGTYFISDKLDFIDEQLKELKK
jgi:hypothetical protein